MRYLLIIILAMIWLASCAGYKTHKYPGTINDENQREVTIRDHVDFYSKSGEDQLRYAKQFSGEGDYQTAIELFLNIYQNEMHDPIIRQKALINLGNIYSNVLYSGKDYEKALFYWETLLKEFPETEFRSEAEDSIENIKRLMHED